MARKFAKDWPISARSLIAYLQHDIEWVNYINRISPGEIAASSIVKKTLRNVLKSVRAKRWASGEGIVCTLQFRDPPVKTSLPKRPPSKAVRVRATQKGYAIVYKSSMFCEHANECPQSCTCPFDCSCRESMCPPLPPPSGAPVVLIPGNDSRRKRR